ncbi:MAG: hypothetical protein A2Y81_01720 [Nitrospirae bacterium RBG_13_43_8]|nr:MAG: hypothetical protein A2Y81_01720 [Nitrospirae bacterium RBG_13_43_8]
MCAEPIREFSHFIGIEEENVLKSIANLGDNFFLIHNLDILFKNSLELEPLDDVNLKIPAFLYLILHSEFYQAMASFLRMHHSKSFVSLRIALDCAFTAYYLIKHPDKTDIYLSKLNEEEKPEWKTIFFNIKRSVKNDIDNFPLAKGLPEIHEFCSIYSHSDAIGILHRYRMNDAKLKATYFDYEPKLDDYNKWLAQLLGTFFRIYLVFWQEIFAQKAGGKKGQIENSLREYSLRLHDFTKKYPVGDVEAK